MAVTVTMTDQPIQRANPHPSSTKAAVVINPTRDIPMFTMCTSDQAGAQRMTIRPANATPRGAAFAIVWRVSGGDAIEGFGER